MNEIRRLQAGEACLIHQRYAARVKVAPVSPLAHDERAIAPYKAAGGVNPDVVAAAPELDL